MVPALSTDRIKNETHSSQQCDVVSAQALGRFAHKERMLIRTSTLAQRQHFLGDSGTLFKQFSPAARQDILIK